MMATKIYACYNREQERMQSSSGGIFYLLAKQIILENGVVFGARFNENWEVEHGYCENLEEIHFFMQSKYVQSTVGDTYVQVKQFLLDGRKVLYSGTPCQISGLNAFLNDINRDNLFTVDFICHGVPSRKVWRRFLSEISQDKEIVGVNFRDKTEGWLKFSLKIDFSDGTSYRKNLKNDSFIKGFLYDLYLRPSCYECRFRGIERNSDITLADFWGVQDYVPNMFDDKGTSIVLVHSVAGRKLLDDILIKMEIYEIEKDIVISRNSAAVKSCDKNPNRKKFFSEIKKGKTVVDTVTKYAKEPIIVRTKQVAKKILKRIIGSIR